MDPLEIVSAEIVPLNLALTEPFSISGGSQNEVRNVLIKLYLKNGSTGLGEAAPFPAVSGETQESTIAALRGIIPSLVGRDIRHWKKLCLLLSAQLMSSPSAMCGAHMAITDAFCNAFNISVNTLLGGYENSLITDMTITASDLEHAEKSAVMIWERGIRTIKIKTAGKDIALDFERIRKIKEAAPEASLTVDGNCGYSLKGAFELLNKLEKADIKLLFFEQPFPREAWKDMQELSKANIIKIAADESARYASDVLKIVNEQSAQIINIKLMKSGLFEAIQIAEIAKAAGLELMIGGMVETILAMTFSAHYATGIGGFRYADLDTPLFIKSHPFKGGFELNGEIIKVDTEKPGHGVSLLL